jgi:hypothetical protein
MEAALAVCAGIALAAAAGLRVFVPLLAASAAAYLGHLDLAPGVGWLGTAPALVALCVATALGLGAAAARLGGASLLRGAWRVAFWGAVAMGCAAVVGRLFGAVV